MFLPQQYLICYPLSNFPLLSRCYADSNLINIQLAMFVSKHFVGFPFPIIYVHRYQVHRNSANMYKVLILLRYRNSIQRKEQITLSDNASLRSTFVYLIFKDLNYKMFSFIHRFYISVQWYRYPVKAKGCWTLRKQ